MSNWYGRVPETIHFGQSIVMDERTIAEIFKLLLFLVNVIFNHVLLLCQELIHVVNNFL